MVPELARQTRQSAPPMPIYTGMRPTHGSSRGQPMGKPLQLLTPQCLVEVLEVRLFRLASGPIRLNPDVQAG